MCPLPRHLLQIDQNRRQEDITWLEDLVSLLWPYASNALEAMAEDMLPDILAASRPSFVHDLSLKKFELGREEPTFSNLRYKEQDA